MMMMTLIHLLLGYSTMIDNHIIINSIIMSILVAVHTASNNKPLTKSYSVSTLTSSTPSFPTPIPTQATQ